MTGWPFTIPEDLRKALDEQEEFRDSPATQDRWLAIKEWLEAHGVKAPEELPRRPDEDHHRRGH